MYPGNIANPTAQYVELQTFAPDQNLVSGHAVTFYGASGSVTGTATFTADVPNGKNQATILVGTANAASQFGVTPDLTIASAALLSPSGGAVCWDTVDCVSWGSFSGSLPSPAGTPAAAIPDGSALRRTIARGCSTALDAADDTDNSSADFAAATPNPRNNSTPPIEALCSGGGSGGGGSGGGGSGGGGSKAFTFGGIKDDRRSGTAALIVKVPGPGTLVLSGTGVKKVTKTVSEEHFSSSVTLPVRPTGKTKARLAKTHKVRVVVSVAFTPMGGHPSSQSKTVKLVKKR